mmetsp:Transcript_3484/g.9540  ORF Transcript_3484/g.9540 Transcript_3484/m.9540 type:complete len:80 (-) Transcript_3484:143-382(-)
MCLFFFLLPLSQSQVLSCNSAQSGTAFMRCHVLNFLVPGHEMLLMESPSAAFKISLIRELLQMLCSAHIKSHFGNTQQI